MYGMRALMGGCAGGRGGGRCRGGRPAGRKFPWLIRASADFDGFRGRIEAAIRIDGMRGSTCSRFI